MLKPSLRTGLQRALRVTIPAIGDIKSISVSFQQQRAAFGRTGVVLFCTRRYGWAGQLPKEADTGIGIKFPLPGPVWVSYGIQF